MSPAPQAGDGPPGRKSMLLRLDPAVHAALARWAADELRSTNAHVEWLLRAALERADRLPRPARGRRTADDGGDPGAST